MEEHEVGDLLLFGSNDGGITRPAAAQLHRKSFDGGLLCLSSDGVGGPERKLIRGIRTGAG